MNSGKLEHTNEEYGLEDTVSVRDQVCLEKLFGNQIILGQMKSLEQLVIYGADEDTAPTYAFELNRTFENLNYLAIQNVLFTNADILKSSNIEHLIIDHAGFKEANVIRRMIEEFNMRKGTFEDSFSYLMYDFDVLKSRQVKYLRIGFESEYCLFTNCVKNQLFSALEHLNVILSDFETLSYVCENFPTTLKRIDCLIGVEKSDFLEAAEEVNLEEIASRIRSDLSVYICGILFKRGRASLVVEFFKKFQGMIEYKDSRVKFTGFSISYEYLEKFEEDTVLDSFYKLIHKFYAHDVRTVNENLFRKFTGCKVLELGK